MNTENTNTADSQQPNPGEGAGAATDAANPNGQSATAPAAAPGQGEGGDKTGSDAGNQGDQGKAGDEGKTGDGQGKTDDEQPVLTGAPEAYTDFTLPDGFTLDGERKDVALSLFRDLGLSQAGAQRAIDHFIKTVGEDAAMQQQAMEAAVAQQRDDWGKQAKAELGDQYDAEVKFATTAVHALQNPKLVAAFDELGWGNHPELIKAFAMFGKMMRDSPVDGIGSGGSAKPDVKPWNRLYPDM
ncbi:protease [Xanthomonas phage Olaya]|nr:protease [Xanthomonas phage Olaya]QTZ82429.1 protease [Xanthomonas phage Bolivar]QTZ82526.1 protease [Xanthomonas phage Usaquen]QTZ82543.1 protease [Xanthomonas phage Alcala]QTZ82596.1 protease [Xanthomonas phage Fontebon]QTZ82694.1 protease [Xanthomonas phage Soumapaz]CAA2366744.1 Phage-associated protease [Xylella phage Usme]